VTETAGARIWIHNSGMAVLLTALVLTVFVMPAFVPNGATRSLLGEVLISLILVSGVVAVSEHRKTAIALAVVSAAVIVLGWTQFVVPAAHVPGLRDLAAMGAFGVLAAAVGINVFASGHQIGDRVFGAVVLYLLMGLIWGVAYHIVDSRTAGAFSVQSPVVPDLSNWVYFSFVTLTTVGYGDITPVAQSARSLATLEALVGQLYPAVIIARLVSLQASRS
jgi:Ion channel